ncbi:hypothetical protein HCU64_06765 [Methylobacterium sp. C25]|uniref:hypothetical protein n=1 Tax=Methylobacterium sp. C25 TaxID=2721622 RepID=UPI001F267318|nr:hypothetical protein [Methylobacterium sp. C25]MCE4223448.1 hypothetical protein [Methylobacterium sp. C25]
MVPCPGGTERLSILRADLIEAQDAEGRKWFAPGDSEANAAFIVALENAYRSGELVHRSASTAPGRLDREAVARAIRSALVENWSDAANARRWDEDVLLTGCRKVGGGKGYEKPEEAAQNLALEAADAILALALASPTAQGRKRENDKPNLRARITKTLMTHLPVSRPLAEEATRWVFWDCLYKDYVQPREAAALATAPATDAGLGAGVPLNRDTVTEITADALQALRKWQAQTRGLREPTLREVVETIIRKALAASLSQPETVAGGASLERVRHVKRGTEYEVLGEAEAQVSHNKLPTASFHKRPIQDGDAITVYRCIKTGKLWCRFTDEFRDGRFEALPTAPARGVGGE